MGAGHGEQPLFGTGGQLLAGYSQPPVPATYL
jgi:hypothetical protein